jgi:hypothetical protein
MSDPENLEALVSHLQGEFGKKHAEFPTTLFHYTSAEGVVGILTTRQLWLTDLRYVNDLSELQYARELVASRLALAGSAQQLQAVLREFLRRAAETFDGFQSGNAVYCASFCEDGNLLSQWRAYRGRGGGYAIGIDFFQTIRLLNRHCALRKVIYDSVAQTTMVDVMIKGFLDFLAGQVASKGGAATTELLPSVCGAFQNTVTELLFTFKHPDFSEEREWRLVHFANIDARFNRGIELPQFRTFEGNIIPYFAVSFDDAVTISRDDTSGVRFPFVELVIGPTINAALNEKSIISLMLALNPDFEPIIRHSGIPLRWL